MDLQRKEIRRAFNSVDPAHLYELSGDPEEYAAEVDCLMRCIDLTPPHSCEEMIELIRHVLNYTLHGGSFGVFLLGAGCEGHDMHSDPPEKSCREHTGPVAPPTAEEICVGTKIWTALNTQNDRG